MQFRHLDLFSGIGGFALAASWVWPAHNIHAFVEQDKYCQKVLEKHWPDVPIIDDIKDYKHDGTKIDILTGGFPCQPFSCAGKRGGAKDDRFLWPQMLRVIREVQPTWIIGENVPGIINMELDRVLTDLESENYACQTFNIPACAVDAPHQRQRIWIVANAKRTRLEKREKQPAWQKLKTTKRSGGVVSNSTNPGTETMRKRQNEACYWKPESNVGRVAHGIPRRVDRLKGLGNAIVPQVAAALMEMIK